MSFLTENQGRQNVHRKSLLTALTYCTVQITDSSHLNDFLACLKLCVLQSLESIVIGLEACDYSLRAARTQIPTVPASPVLWTFPPKHETFLHLSLISFYHQWENKLDSQESTFQLSSKRSDNTEQKITQVPLVIKKEHSRAHNWEEGLMCFDTSIAFKWYKTHYFLLIL